MKKWLIVLLMVFLVASIGVIASAQENEQEPVPLVVVYLDTVDEIDVLFEAGLDIVQVDKVNLELEVVLNEFDKKYLNENDYFYEILVEDLVYRPEPSIRLFSTSVTGRTDYRTWNEYVDEMYELELLYPDFVKVHILGYSHENNPIYALEISSAVGIDDGRPESYHCGLHHAREWPSGEMSMDLAWYLMLNYGEDEQATNIVDTIRTWIFPVVNPDGFLFSQNVQQMWRKSRSPNVGGSFGVDLNRNYAYGWGGRGSSGSPSAGTFRGVAPFSEPELWGIRDLFLSRHIITAIDGHTHGRYILWPWGWKTPAAPPHHDIFSLLGWQYQAINQYPAARTGPVATTIYVADGNSVDWQYGATGTLAYCFEYGTAFIPPYMGTITTVPTLETDQFGDISGNMLRFSLPPDGEEGILVDCGRGLEPGDFPEEVAGNIALIERGDDTFRNKADRAADAGAVAAIIYNNVSGGFTGTLGSAGCPIPVMGISRADGLTLLSGVEVQATLDAKVSISNAYFQEWERNLPAFLLNIEAAETYSSVISGSVTDKLSGEMLEASLDMEIALQSVTAQGAYIDQPKSTSIQASGSYEWHVLPSQQPELTSPPYSITASAPGRYSKTVELAVASYAEMHQLDFELQPVAQLQAPLNVRKTYQPNSTIPFKFVTFNKDGEITPMEGVTVRVLLGEEEIASFAEGSGARAIRPGDIPGEYIVNISTNHLNMGEGVYEVIIEFSDADDNYSFSTDLIISRQQAVVLDEAA